MATSSSIARSAASRAPAVRSISARPSTVCWNSSWGRDIYIDERTVDVHIGRLRKLLNPGREQDPIRTVRGAGYALDDRFAKAAE
jgi:hypothetical protein